jgi:hypothetical protein
VWPEREGPVGKVVEWEWILGVAAVVHVFGAVVRL